MKTGEQLTMLAVSIIGCELLGTLGAIIALPSILSWYNFLNTPSWFPPSTVFGTIWVVLYAVMGAAAYLVWSRGYKKKNVKPAMDAFGTQLGLNLLWSLIFFGYKAPLYALVDAALLWLMVLYTIIRFYKVSKPAAYLMIPYIIWLSFAIVLNYFVLVLNPT